MHFKENSHQVKPVSISLSGMNKMVSCQGNSLVHGGGS